MSKLLIIVLALFAVSCSTNEAIENSASETMENETEAVMNVEETEEDAQETASEDMTVFNAESLAKYNGEDGMKAYVAVDGLVYDVTDVAAWQTPHAGRLKPGKDYSNEIKQSPHGKKNLEGLEVVGTYED